MGTDWTVYVTAVASVTSVLVAIGAVLVAHRATGIARESASIAKESAAAARRQIALQGIPYLVASRPQLESTRTAGQVSRMIMHVTNGGGIPALGTIVEVHPAAQRNAPIESTRAKSGAAANIAPGDPHDLPISLGEDIRSAEPGGQWVHPWLVIRLRYRGPYGARVVQSFEWATGPKARIWRLRSMEIDPADGGDVIRFELSL